MTAAAVEQQPKAGTMSPPAAAPAAPPITPITPVDPLAYTDAAPEFSQKTLDALAVPVDPELVEERAVMVGSEAKLLYVPWVHYQAVLLKAFGPGGYRLVPRGVPRTEGNVITWHGALFVRERGSTKFQFIKEAKGECKVTGAMTAGNLAEGAQSDCLVKCCKGLGIFMELFDPRWRRAWEAKYRGQHQKNVNAAQWPARRPAAGSTAAVGAVPAAATSSPASAPAGSSPSTPAAAAAGTESSASSSTPPEAGTVSPLADTSEAATADQKEAIVTHIRKRKWTKAYVRVWFGQLFGREFAAAENPVEALSQQQADAAFTLVLAHGTGNYEKLLAEEREKGMVL